MSEGEKLSKRGRIVSFLLQISFLFGYEYFIEGNLILSDICLKFGGTPSILHKRGAFVSFLRDE